ncbi:phosphate ABC transporter substrate-binding protein PstS family protein [Companilactobacillus sp.]|uniref:phosphate ABC transporter substrate-binding protein PstS family protein n=1 Tax=Companilactobacillus sp. TaxID=2767905 RepID=UPI0025BA89C5|nr:phosphate ABC transporter substrate-binding protein PstS family protein [Companilactobacillus sp.]MCH4008799.1 phosphate ABC transporter substrate-binding protein PstS family protein [Companilactobacillus sp.]MCH4051022.1 phosphate ABC transporter substrate-binding protein PstS family protein [Companilactobacillus sp.]MCH4076742.1 phosphate ABC transporter substrate-binding protein PstS family protein [Companilactobacillus sp.]MCH4125317.1 phosphate ABC transporter substrate-binding protein 
MKKRIVALFVLLFSAVFVLTGCKGSQGQQTITAVGSSAAQPLVELAGEEFTQNNPNQFVNVQGGGTGTGLSQIQQGAVDIGDSDLFAEQKSGIDSSKLIDHRICAVGMVPVVNKNVSVDTLTLKQLRQIFSGEITNWKQVGGEDLPITIINRADGSGTRAAFQADVMGNAQFVRAQEQDSSGMVRQIVDNTKGSISYLAMPYLNNTVKTMKIDNVKPTIENIQNNKWKIWSYEHLYTNGEPTGMTKEFLDYIMTTHIQNNVVKKLRYVPIKEMKFQKDTKGNVTPVSQEGK